MYALKGLEEDVWAWVHELVQDLTLSPHTLGWSTMSVMMYTMIASVLIYDCLRFLVDYAALEPSGHRIVTTFMGRRRQVRSSGGVVDVDVGTPPHGLVRYRSVERSRRVLSAIQKGRERYE
ncbi:hypothetical protein Pmani_013023 [Petrolisthes manimaculis]|uniref:Uncharacterized protein n=1 Tax=Petrolisthes manimaculis TaxID=1843537 RepID=A0AAE1UE27_9EUCA|nr:hypothetical protein Pmani_013023 [Petrolisthes manimaculis]